jgi:hypothetical protein
MLAIGFRRIVRIVTCLLLACTFAVDVHAVCIANQSCQSPSEEQATQLFAMIEQLYPALFVRGTTIQTYTSGNASGHFRVYAEGAASLGVFQGGMWYALGKGWMRYSSIDEANAQFCAGTCFAIPTDNNGFRGNIVLGSPTDSSVKANVYVPDQSGNVYLVYGTTSGVYNKRSANAAIAAAVPVELQMDRLNPDTRYYYRLYFQDSTGNSTGATEEYSFHTQRPPGTAFTFALQGDSHPERERSQFDATLYTRTLQTAAADKPDFYLLMGDDFSVDTLNPLTITRSQVAGRYTLQRPFLGQIGRSAPLFLVNGNHEQSARYLLDGTPDNVAVWAQTARNSLYSQPAPDNFYSGNHEVVPFIGLLRNYFAWNWGDALFVAIDFYWGSDVCVDNSFFGDAKRSDLWDVTLGEAQYAWLKKTLEQSKSKYKFVFAHHVLGTGRGGIEVAPKFEWGGLNNDGITNGFRTRRSALPATIHQLLVDNNVTIFFQGHDHIWVRQTLDGVTYQTLSEPADPNYSLFNDSAFKTGNKFPNTGYTRVNVSDAGVRVDYVRTYLPKDETGGRTNGEIAYSYLLK